MIVHQARIQYKLGETKRIKILGDIHAGSSHCDERAAKEFINDPDCYFLGIGDLMDMVIASDSKRYRKSGDASDGDAIVDEQIEKLSGWLRPHKDRILGLGTGNHEDSITKHCGTNPTQRICKDLGVPFLGYSWLMELTLSEGGSRGRSVKIRGHHGFGGGSRTQGADLTKYAREASNWDADIFLYGHVHRKQADRIPRLGNVGPKLISKPKLIAITGTFLRTYSKTTDPTYSECKGYPPTEIGGVTINIKPDSSWVKYWADL